MPTRQLLPPIEGKLATAIGEIRFRFIPSGTGLPSVLLTNHGCLPTFQFDVAEVRIKFLIVPTANGGWQRSDAGEPHLDYVDRADTVPELVRTQVHDACLDVWELYLAQRPELVPLARVTDVNNQIFQIEDKMDRLSGQLDQLRGKRDNLAALESRIKATIPETVTLSDDERHILSFMNNQQCWLALREGKDAELHPFNSPDVLEKVNDAAANSLILRGFVQLHRYLADKRTVFKMADRGWEIFEGKKL